MSSCAACLCISPYFCEDTFQAQTSSKVLIEMWWTNCSFCLPSSLLIVPFFETTSAHTAAPFSVVIPKAKGCTTNPSLCWLPRVWAAEVLTSNLVWEFDYQTLGLTQEAESLWGIRLSWLLNLSNSSQRVHKLISGNSYIKDHCLKETMWSSVPLCSTFPSSFSPLNWKTVGNRDNISLCMWKTPC